MISHRKGSIMIRNKRGQFVKNDNPLAVALDATDYNLATDDCDTCRALLGADQWVWPLDDAEIIRRLRIHLNSGHYVMVDEQGRNIIP